jgi:hypothetical protein
MPPRDELPGEVKAYIVQRLACFDTPTRVAKAVKDEFDVTVSRQRVHYYDPTHRMGRALMPELAALFRQTREKFLNDPPQSPIFKRNYRLAVLQRALDIAEARGQLVEVRAILEQAAKEEGEAFTNRLKLEHTGKDGEAIKVEATRERLLDRLARATAARRMGAVPKPAEPGGADAPGGGEPGADKG